MNRGPSLVLVGRGRMGGAFVRAAREERFDVVVMRGRARRRGPRPFGRAPIVWLLAVTDRVIAETCAQLVASGWISRGDTVSHFAGMLGTDVLAPARNAGAFVAAVHPLVAVADARRPPALRNGAVSFEGDARALRVWRSLAQALGLRLFRFAHVDRVRYHAGAALMATGGVALAQGAAHAWIEALEPSSDRTVRAFAASLLRSVAHNIEAVGIERALASPLLRGETGTVERHLRALADRPAARDLYAAALTMVLDTLERTRALDPDVVRAARIAVRSGG